MSRRRASDTKRLLFVWYSSLGAWVGCATWLPLTRLTGSLFPHLSSLKRVVVYYGVWEPPPSNATRFLFMEQVLVPKLDFEAMRQSARLRGFEVERITKLDLILLLGECFELEVEVRGVDGHEAFQTSEEQIKVTD